MRLEVVKAIYNRALSDKKIFFLTGDMGHTYLEDFQKNLSDQYINIGIAEQNMIGIAAGLALSGNKVFVYSITPFITMRCYEQIRVDICCQNVNVTVIGVGAGFAYGANGNTHHAIEDIAIMRALPNMRIYCPSNPLEARLITEYLFTRSHPAYLRIGNGKETVPPETSPVQINKGLIVRPGHDLTIFSTGAIVNEAIEASKLLGNNGISAEVINIHTIKPLDEDLIINRAQNRDALFVLEEHNIMGGLGEHIARIICELGQERKIIFKCFGISDQYSRIVGSQKFMRGLFGLNAKDIAEEILKLYNKA